MKVRLRNDSWEISEKNSSKKWFPTQLNSTAKNSRTAVFQESLALNFKWNALTAGISLTSFHIFHSCTILVYSICHTGFLLHLGRFQHCKLGEFVWRTQVQIDFIFHAVLFSRETFQTLAWKFLLCVSQKICGVYIFPYFVLK